MTVALDRQFPDQPDVTARPTQDLPPRPVAAVAAAVLGFVFAALYLLGTVLVVLAVTTQGLPAGGGAELPLLLVTLTACLLTGLLLAGGLAAIRGTGRILLLTATTVETALVLAACIGAARAWPAAGEGPDLPAVPDLGRTVTTAAVTIAAALLAVLALRLVIAALPRWAGGSAPSRPPWPGHRADGRWVGPRSWSS